MERSVNIGNFIVSVNGSGDYEYYHNSIKCDEATFIMGNKLAKGQLEKLEALIGEYFDAFDRLEHSINKSKEIKSLK